MIEWFKEELPDSERNVLICLVNGEVVPGYFYKGFWFCYPNDRDTSIQIYDIDVRCWANMPDAPKEI